MARPVLHQLRRAVGGALSLTAAGLSAGARLTGAAAEALRHGSRGTSPEPPAAATSPAEEVARTYEARGRVLDRTQETVPFTDDISVTEPTHAAELAARGASAVLAAIPGLSTDELRLLYETETAGKRRKTVLAAIERSLAPGPDEVTP